MAAIQFRISLFQAILGMNKRKDPRLYQQVRTEQTARSQKKKRKKQGSEHTEAERLCILFKCSGERTAERI